MSKENRQEPTATWTLHTDTAERWAYCNDVFSKEECENIIEFCKSYNLYLGETTGGAKPDYRNSKIVFIQPVSEIEWVYRRLTDVVLSSNNAHFKFDLFSFGESLQFTQYDAPSGKYNYHIDKVVNGPIRKLSIVLQLSDSESYEGGDFEILDSETPEQLPRKQGTVLLFPSYTLHRVTEVTKGTRHSLVGWINGPMFK